MTGPVRRTTVPSAVGENRRRIQILEASVSNPGEAIYPIKVISDTTVLTTGDGKFIFLVTVADAIAGLNLTGCGAYVTTVSSSGLPTVQIRNITQSWDILSTKLSIDASEFSSDTATTPYVIDPSKDLISLGDRIAIDVDVAGTGAKGLGVILVFS